MSWLKIEDCKVSHCSTTKHTTGVCKPFNIYSFTKKILKKVLTSWSLVLISCKDIQFNMKMQHGIITKLHFRSCEYYISTCHSHNRQDNDTTEKFQDNIYKPFGQTSWVNCAKCTDRQSLWQCSGELMQLTFPPKHENSEAFFVQTVLRWSQKHPLLFSCSKPEITHFDKWTCAWSNDKAAQLSYSTRHMLIHTGTLMNSNGTITPLTGLQRYNEV